MQQIGKRDLLRALDVARAVLERRKDITFTFSLKPEFPSAAYKHFERPGLRVENGGASFRDGLPTYDALLSPAIRTDSTLSPPLTWIEALSAGVPILTTSCAGIEEQLEHQKSGLICPNFGALAELLCCDPHLKESLQSMRAPARAAFEKAFSIERAVEEYLKGYLACLSG
jgi:glycosyltransferase involved in cell wall biosynthesis